MKCKQQDYEDSSGYIRRLIITGIAILSALAVVIISAKLLGEFIWHV